MDKRALISTLIEMGFILIGGIIFGIFFALSIRGVKSLFGETGELIYLIIALIGMLSLVFYMLYKKAKREG